jgi:hypothetical protein
MNAHVRLIAPYVIRPADILHVAHGGGHRDLPSRALPFGGIGGDVSFDARAPYIDIISSPNGPGVVQWKAIADVIAAGVQHTELVEAVRDACVRYSTAVSAQQDHGRAHPWRPGLGHPIDPAVREESDRLRDEAADAHHALIDAARGFVDEALGMDQLELDLMDWISEGGSGS